MRRSTQFCGVFLVPFIQIHTQLKKSLQFLSAGENALRHISVNQIIKLKHSTVKNFMLIFRGGNYAMEMSPEESQQYMQKWFSWIGELQGKGIYAAGEALLPTGKTVKTGNVVTDGPYAESKEIVGGFFIVKAASIEEASEIAKSCPDLPLGGSVEVRDVVVFDNM